MIKKISKDNFYPDTDWSTGQFKKQFGKVFFFSVAGVFSLYLGLSFAVENLVIVPRGVLAFAFFLTIYTGFIISKTKFDFIIIFRILILAITFFIAYIVLLLVNVSDAVFFLFVPVVLMMNFLFSFRVAAFTCLLIFCFHFFAWEISNYFEIALSADFYAQSPQNLTLQENIGFVIAIYFSLLILFYTDKIYRSEKYATTKIVSNEGKLEEKIVHSDFKDQSESLTDDEKYHILFKKIMNCLEVSKPYQDPDFNIRKLADMVQSNTTYVSKALNKVGDKKFSQLVNDYRIQQVKIDLDSRTHYKFTIEHIYKAAGFSQQSTFNRIFKEYMGKTPSEYIDLLKKEDYS